MAVFLQEAGLYGEGAEAGEGRGGVISGGTVCEIPVRFFLFCFARSKLVYEKIVGTCKDVKSSVIKFRVEITCLAVGFTLLYVIIIFF